MDTQEIVRMLTAERDKLQIAINALTGGGGGVKRRGRPPKNPLTNAPESVVTGTKEAAPAAAPKSEAKKRTFSAAQRKAQAEKMKAYWAAKKKATKK
jgi:hypothetical protein